MFVETPVLFLGYICYLEFLEIKIIINSKFETALRRSSIMPNRSAMFLQSVESDIAHRFVLIAWLISFYHHFNMMIFTFAMWQLFEAVYLWLLQVIRMYHLILNESVVL